MVEGGAVVRVVVLSISRFSKYHLITTVDGSLNRDKLVVVVGWLEDKRSLG